MITVRFQSQASVSVSDCLQQAMFCQFDLRINKSNCCNTEGDLKQELGQDKIQDPCL